MHAGAPGVHIAQIRVPAPVRGGDTTVVRTHAIPRPSALRRSAAAMALTAFGAALIVIAAVLVRSLIVLPFVLVGLATAVLAGWSSLVCHAPGRRWASLLIMAGALLGT